MILLNQMQQITFGALWGGPGIALTGLLLSICTITALHCRRPGAFWFACVYGSQLTLALPYGTPFGVFLLVYAPAHKKEFLREQPGDQQVVV